MAKELNNRSGLLWQIERILNELKELSKKQNKLPKFLLLENVKNMISKRHKPQYDLWLKSLKELGYSTRTFVLDTKNFGSPQHRERVFAISILNYSGKIDKNGNILDLDNLDQIFETNSLKHIIKEDYSNVVYKKEALESQPNRTPSRKKMFLENYCLNDFKNYQFSRTLTTKQDRHPNAGVINLKNTILDTKTTRLKTKANFRFLTPRETYLLMGFEEVDFDKVIKTSFIPKQKLYQQAGNSINVNTIAPIMLLIQRKFNEDE